MQHNELSELMKITSTSTDANKRLQFNQDDKTVKEAKRKASIIFNKNKTKSINEFNYVTKNGTYVFTRRNIICPNGTVIFGTWK